jgi:dipeptidyl aminopeptidase/acylaminoacyl peptidase
MKGKYFVACVLATMAISGPCVPGSQAPDKRSITVEDCVGTRRIMPGEVQISTDGGALAYVVKSPDVRTNQNNYILYVRSLRKLEPRENGRRILEAEKIAGIRWLDKGRLVARVEIKERAQTRDRLIIVDIATGTQEAIDCPSGTDDYSITPDGRTIAFSTEAQANPVERGENPAATVDQRLRGYEVPFRKDRASFLPPTDCEIKIYRRTGKNGFKVSKLWFTGPGETGRRSILADVEALNLSPDGKYLLFRYWNYELPKEWEEQPVIQQFRAMHSPGVLYALALCDVSSGRLRYAFNFSGGFIIKTTWAGDSRSYAVVSPSPFGSDQGNDEERAAAASGNAYYYTYRFSHVFTIDVTTGAVTRVLSRDSGTPGDSVFRSDGPLGWERSQGAFVLRTGVNQFTRMNFKDGKWREAGRFEFTEPGSFGSSFASDGHTIVGVSQSDDIPPDILLMDIVSKKRTLLTNLNPEYLGINLGRVENFEWTNRFGSRSLGKLIKPVGYESGKRYPFVLMATSSGDEFVSDAPYTTAFAPQSLANAGFVVLLAKYPIDNKIPAGAYPGEISEAFNWMAMVENAIDLLSEQGLIDRDRVGIVGFSRTSWLVDFTLTHSTYRFGAASSADGEAYTYTGYTRFLDMGALLTDEAELGGPPYGNTLKYWLEYAAPFNAGRVQAPLLMEYTRMEAAYELFTLLNRQGKPVELYFYPNGHHPLDTPFQRVGSLQRNVDWFRFWLQGYERPTPEDPEQYTRWRALRAMENEQ